MHFVIQTNLMEAKEASLIVDAAVRQKVDMSEVLLIPFGGEIKPDVNTDDNVMAFGSTSMKEVSESKGWTPGYIDYKLTYDQFVEGYENELLNHDCHFGTFKNMPVRFEQFFVRPETDRKQFAGQVMSRKEFYTFRSGILALGGDQTSFTTIKPDDGIIMAPIKHIESEYRFFVIDGYVITGSQYKKNGRVVTSRLVSKEARRYAQDMVDKWCPNRAFAIDIAERRGDFKVIELNSINSSGFYGADMDLLIWEINNMKF